MGTLDVNVPRLYMGSPANFNPLLASFDRPYTYRITRTSQIEQCVLPSFLNFKELVKRMDGQYH